MLHHLIFFLLAARLIQISVALTCADAPDESTQHLCRQMQHWERNARIYDVRRQHSIGRKLFAEAITDGYSVLDCRTIKCICDTQNGQMINKNRCVLPNGRIYEKAIRKEYRLEISLRLIDPDLYLPYWDSILDSRIPDSNQSCIYTDELQGEVNSTFYVTSGPFKYWKGRTKCPYKTNFGSFEYRHGNPHNFIAGDMWLTSRFERESQYPEDNPDCSAPAHFGDRTMTPFAPLLNRDGLSNVYTDELYEYAPRPSCSAREPSCGSKFLFCDMSHGAPRCASKIKASGRCSGYTNGESQCFGGSCIQGICVASTVVTTTVTTTTTTTTMPSTIQPSSVPIPTASTTSRIRTRTARTTTATARTTTVTSMSSSTTSATCADNNQYCQSWADHGHCDLNPEYMLQNCRLSCRIC